MDAVLNFNFIALPQLRVQHVDGEMADVPEEVQQLVGTLSVRNCNDVYKAAIGTGRVWINCYALFPGRDPFFRKEIPRSADRDSRGTSSSPSMASTRTSIGSSGSASVSDVPDAPTPLPAMPAGWGGALADVDEDPDTAMVSQDN